MDTTAILQQKLNEYLARETVPQRKPPTLYEPIEYIMSLGGKRVRPLLCLLGAHIFGAKPEAALPAAAAIEYFHNFTLVHDDVMDNAPLRRGQPTMHTKYDLNVSILSGDVMLVKAYELMCRLPANVLPHVLQVFNQTGFEVCEGQRLDMDFEQRDFVAVEEYLEMICLKTAVLLAASLKIGALVAGASDGEAQKLYEYGKNMGMVFQLRDDLLDVYADKAKFGKRPAGDIIQNKKTYLLLTALNKAQGQTLRELQNLLHGNKISHDEKVDGVKAIYDQLGVRQATENQMEYYQAIALEQLGGLGVEAGKLGPLLEIADFLLQRQH